MFAVESSRPRSQRVLFVATCRGQGGIERYSLRLASELRSRGAKEIANSQGFIVLGKSGPLAQGEEKRAAAWGATLAAVGATAAFDANA